MTVASPVAELGLSDAEAARRLAADGPNLLPAAPVPSLVRRTARQLAEPLSALLLVAALVSVVVLGQPAEGAAIGAIVVVNMVVGVGQERRADAAVAALADLTAPTARVRRSGRSVVVHAADVVRDDLVELAPGDRVPADMALIEAAALAVDEAMLTGEAVPAEKEAGKAAAPGAGLADRPGQVFAGTLVVRGRGLARVTATGPASAIGAIAAAMGRASLPPLVGQLRAVAARVTALALALGAVLAIVILLRGRGDHDLADALLAGIALAVAAIPEGLATVVTSALALGARRMARRGAIVRSLPAVEAVGAANVICTDKTGTITTGRLAVAGTVFVPGRADDFWAVALLCNDADGRVGDPIDVALVDAARAAGSTTLLGARIAERPFDTRSQLMATVHRTPTGPVLSVKGAPEVVLPRCRAGEARSLLERSVDELATRGLRVLALASAPTDDLDAAGLDALGLVAFEDPLRTSARDAVEACRRAGIRLVLVTGDHLATAVAVAARAGLDAAPAVSGPELAAMDQSARTDALAGAAVVGRVDPGTKVDLVEAHHRTGGIVAMTGDGVNDAPALRRADVGVALAGAGGTDVAREAADLVVTDGDLGTLVAAVREGRQIYRNLVSVVSYLLTGNVSEVLVVLAALIVVPDLAVPLLPVQLLWVNFVTDGLPALALGVDRAPGDPLDAPPRGPDERLLGGQRLRAIAGRALVVASLVVATGVLVRGWGWSDEQVRAQLLLSLIAAHLVLAYAVRARRRSLEPGWWRNRVLLGAVGGSIMAQVPVFMVPQLRDAFGLVPLPPVGWGLAAAGAAATLMALDLVRVLVGRPRIRRPALS